MCKVMILKGIENSALALDFMRAVVPNMSIMNTDGIGYAAINSKNKLFSEKWHNNAQFLDTETVVDEKTLEQLKPFKARIPNVKLNYKTYGEVTRDDLRTVTMHTRYATCGKEFENTHPFIDNEMSLIHNGVISNQYLLGLNKVSTCDSENALQLYNNVGLNLKTNKDDFQSFIDQLKGYWAFAFLAKDINGNYILDVVRETAPLYWAMLPELGIDCVVFATTKEIIETGVKALGLPERTKIFLLTESIYHRFNAVNGEFIGTHKLEESALNNYSNGYYYNNNKRWKNYRGDNLEIQETLIKEETPPTVDEIYEGYKQSNTAKDKLKESLQGISNDLTFDDFYDTDQLLIDRLYAYDGLMSTQYGVSFEDLPFKVREFIEKKEEEDYIQFDDILKMIESYQETDRISGIYKIYKNKKRA